MDMEAIWTVTAQWLVSRQGLIFLVGFVVVWFVIFMACMLWGHLPARRSLKEALRHLQQYPSEEEFGAGFEDFDQWARSNPLIAHIWSEFVETLIFPGPDEEPQVVRNTQPASEFFTTGNLFPKLNVRGYASVPNLLTGLGILGTFIGLVAGIWLASEGLASEDLGLMKQALAALLHGAALAFLTSIAGLSLSIIFNFSEKRLLHGLDELIDEWCKSLDGVLHRVTPESISVEILHEAKAQRVQLERFNTDLALQIATALDDRLTNRLGPQLDKLIKAVETMSTNQGDSIAGSLNTAVDRMIDKFEKVFSQTAGSELQRLAGTLDIVAQRLEDSAGDYGAESKKLIERMEVFTTELEKRLRDTFSDLDELLVNTAATLKGTHQLGQEQTQELFEHLTREIHGAVEKLQGAFNKLEAASRGFESLIEGQRSAVERTRQVVDSFGQILTPLSGIQHGMTQVSKDLSATVEGVSNIVEATDTMRASIGDILASLEKTNQSVREQHQSLVALLDGYEERFKGIDQSVGSFFDKVNQGVTQYTEEVAKFIATIEENLGKALGSLGAVARELTEAMEELDEKVDEFGNHVNRLVEALRPRDRA